LPSGNRIQKVEKGTPRQWYSSLEIKAEKFRTRTPMSRENHIAKEGLHGFAEAHSESASNICTQHQATDHTRDYFLESFHLEKCIKWQSDGTFCAKQRLCSARQRDAWIG
jgi:hypothetical protein